MSRYRVLINPTWVQSIDWAQGLIKVDLSRTRVINAPRLDVDHNISRDFESQLFSYYDRLPYW